CTLRAGAVCFDVWFISTALPEGRRTDRDRHFMFYIVHPPAIDQALPTSQRKTVSGKSCFCVFQPGGTDQLLCHVCDHFHFEPLSAACQTADAFANRHGPGY